MNRDGLVLGMDDLEYHGGPELSSTGAKKILKSPATFRHYSDNPQPGKTAFDVGHVAHAKVLGVGSGHIAYPPEHLTASGNVSTKPVTEAWAAEQRANGLAPISPDDLARVEAMSEAILANRSARALLQQEGDAEASLFATDPVTGVRLRARYDYRAEIAVDLKTTAGSAAKRDFERTVTRLGYEISDSHYRYTDSLITGEQRPMVFIVVEKEAPHLVGVHQLDIKFREMGDDKALRARERFAACTESGIWPGYSDDIQLVSPPQFALYDHEEEYA